MREIADLVGRRQRGLGMVTPLELVGYHDEDTGAAVLTPGISRLDVDHPIVRDRPEKFTPVARDKRCASRLQQHLRAAGERVARELAIARRGDHPAPLLFAGRSSRSRAPLLTAPPRRRERWRLP